MLNLYPYNPTTITNSVVWVVDDAVLTRGNALDFVFGFYSVGAIAFVE